MRIHSGSNPQKPQKPSRPLLKEVKRVQDVFGVSYSSPYRNASSLRGRISLSGEKNTSLKKIFSRKIK